MLLKFLKYFLFIILFFQVIECREEQRVRYSDIPGNPYLHALLEDYDVYVERQVEKGRTPGAAVAIVYDTSVVFLKGYGVKSSRTGEPVDVHTLFRLGSVSKGFASLLTGLLVRDGRIDWGDKVVHYLPGFSLKSEASTRDLSIRNILSHTSGLPYHSYTNLIEAGWKLPVMVNALREVDLIAPVGRVYSYQNVAYSIIDEVLQSATGQTYQDLMRQRVFLPLRMHDASITYAEMVNSSDKALPHYRYKGSWRPEKIQNTYYNAAPAGGVNASISDMANYLLALLGNDPEVVADSTIQTIFTPVIRTSKYKYAGHWRHLKKAYYGLGWRILITSADTVIYHGGYVNGYRSEIALIPRKKTGICVLTNASNHFAGESVPEFFDKFYFWYDSIDSWQSRNADLQYVALP